MPQWFVELTQPQATFASGLMTFFGAIVAVLLGWKLFSGKVRDIKSALEAADKMLTEHGARVQQSLSDIEEKLGGITASVNRVQADVSDNQAVEEQSDAQGADEQPVATEHTFEDFVSSWVRIRDRLEDIASDSQIDGRTAAKYARIDRRKYADLISSLDRDGRLHEQGTQFNEAARLWASFRTRRKAPPQATIGRMIELADGLATAI